MADNPFEQAGMIQNNAGMNESRQMRMMMMADRMGMQGMRQPHMGGGMGGPSPMLNAMMGMGNQPDYSAFTYDPSMRAEAQAAGINPLAPEQVRQNAILPNSGFFGNHPHLSAMLEGGLFAGAATRGGNTPGESAANVLGGIMEGSLARKGLLNRQFAQPFQNASMLENLQDRKAQIAERNDTAALRHTDMEYKAEQLRQLKAGAGYTKQEMAKPYAVGNDVYGPNPQFNPNAKGTAPYADGIHEAASPWSVIGQVDKSSQKPDWAGTSGNTREYLGILGVKDPDQATPRDWSNARRMQNQDKIDDKVRPTQPDSLNAKQKELMKPIDAQMGKLDTKETTSELRQQVFLDPKWSGKTIDAIDAEVENRRELKRKTLSDQKDKIMSTPASQPSSNRVLVEGKDFH